MTDEENPEPVEETTPPEEPAAEAPEAPAPEAEEAPAPEAEEAPAPEAEEAPAEEAPVEEPVAEAPAAAEETDEPETPRVKPEIPGMDLEPDLLSAEETAALSYSEDEDPDSDDSESDEDELFSQPIADAAIDLAADARYRATGKRKRAVARVILKPGTGAYAINGRTLEEFFPRATLQRTIRQPLETVGYEDRMDVVASMHGGGVSAQAGALRHGVSRALLEADPNLRGELKRRGFLTRDARAKERKKAGLKKARKRPQFSKR
jgi:small subunit ribosomal protein S9